MSEKIAVYPGTFDPMTVGHFDLICRASKLYDRLIVAVAATSVKAGAMFSCEERLAMIREDIENAGLDNVTVVVLGSLLVDLCNEYGAKVVIRGVRVYSDFEYEFQMALTNRKLSPGIETLFMMPSENYAYVTASAVRELARYNGDLSAFVTPAVEARLKERIAAKKEG
jgi:pantetheine-phosphate adenylyltransferase